MTNKPVIVIAQHLNNMGPASSKVCLPWFIWHRLYAAWTGGPVVDFWLYILWLLIRSPVVDIPVYTADETK